MRKFSVALVGPDGSGKTTIARRLERNFPGNLKYLYMGISSESSNVTLPTTRLAEWIKSKLNRQPETPNRSGPANGASRGLIWSVFRVLNRIAEECYRYALECRYIRHGFVVVEDRHYKFDFACDSSQLGKLSAPDRLHRLWLKNVYPYPDLAIFLEAPAEVLYDRKHEGTVEWLSERQQAILVLAQRCPNFVRVDAARPIDTVYAEVEQIIMDFRPGSGLPAREMQAA